MSLKVVKWALAITTLLGLSLKQSSHANEVLGRWATVPPEVITRVDMSNTDVNRLHCDSGDIQDVVFSQEKGISTKVLGSDAFIKFFVKSQGNQNMYTTTPSEFFVVCGGAIYNLVAIPKRIPAVSVQLSTGKKQTVESNISLFKGMPLEKKLLKLIRYAYSEKIPESFEVRSIESEEFVSDSLVIQGRKSILVEGEGLRLKEYTVRSQGHDGGIVQIKEPDFLKAELTKFPLAISVDRHDLTSFQVARLFIVEKAKDAASSNFKNLFQP